LMRGVAQFHRDREVKPGRTATETQDLHPLLPSSISITVPGFPVYFKLEISTLKLRRNPAEWRKDRSISGSAIVGPGPNRRQEVGTVSEVFLCGMMRSPIGRSGGALATVRPD